MISFEVGQSKNGQSSFEIQMADTYRTFVLDGSSEVSLVVPDGCNKVCFGSTKHFFWSRSSFTIPTGLTVNTQVIELDPANRTVTPGETLYFRSIAADTTVNIGFYKGGA